MRVTAEKKQETRRRIVECARKLFNDNGFEQTTTRDIAEAVGKALDEIEEAVGEEEEEDLEPGEDED